MDRRTFLRRAGAAGMAGLAGCSAEPAGTDSPTDHGHSDTHTDTPTGTTVGGQPGTLVVSTYSPFIDAPSTSPGAWLKKQFEKEFDAELIWQTPENEVNYYIQRKNAGVEIDADVYVGLNVDMLIRVDKKLESGSLFAEAGDLANADSIKESLQFDPKGRAVPYDTGYISLVWDATADGGEFEAAETFDDLLEAEYAGDLIAQNPGTSATGRAFLLHTIKAKGANGYLDYWKALEENDVRILGSWSDAYSAYTGGEAPMVVSYSTDQVYANRYDQNMEKHQIRFLNDQGYANPEGMARFADTDVPDLAHDFMSFMLRPEIQGGIAVRNVQFPATTDAEVPEDYSKYAQEPPEAVTFTYDELKGNVSEWIDRWEKQVAGK